MNPASGVSFLGAASDPPRSLSLVRPLPVEEGYALWAASYDEDPNPLLALEERSMEPLVPNLQGKDVIDLGCGTGRWLRKVASRGANSVLGVDLTPEMLECAARDPRIRPRLVLGDCACLPLQPRIADLVICSFTLGHVRNLPGLAKEIARVTRRHAELLLSDLHPDSEAAGWRCAFRHRGSNIEIEAYRHGRSSVRRAFEDAGFVLRESLTCFIGEAEHDIFVQGGKSAMFQAACAVPALAIDHFFLDATDAPWPSVGDPQMGQEV